VEEEESGMIIRTQDADYKSFTRNRLTIFEHRRKPLLDQLERIKNEIDKLRPEEETRKLRGAGGVPAAKQEEKPLISKMETYSERRCRELEAKQQEVEEKLEALDIEAEDIELKALAEETEYLDKKKAEYLEALEKAKKKFEADWYLTNIELKYSEEDYIHKLLKRLESLGERQKEINDLRTYRERKNRQGAVGGRLVGAPKDQKNDSRRAAADSTTEKKPLTPQDEDQSTIMRRRGGGRIERDDK
jgi:hypothetical protein